MPSTAGSVMLQAANHLNDASQLMYTPTKLLPFLNMAIQELEGELGVYDISPLRKDSIIIDVPAGSTTIPQMPTDFLELIQLFERRADSTDDFLEVHETNDIDLNLDDNEKIVEFEVRGTIININPPLTDREVKIDYLRGLVEATGIGTTVDIEASRLFLSLVTARNAAADLGNSPTKANSYEARIVRARDRVVRRLQRDNQSFGVRRLPYRGRLR